MKKHRKFWKAQMRAKIKDCQEVRVRGYQHQDKYIEGDKVSYLHKNSNT